MSKEDGGPAFPTPARYGMTLRDWFAGQALAGIIAAAAHPDNTDLPRRDDTSVIAYAYADAMLKARGEA